MSAILAVGFAGGLLLGAVRACGVVGAGIGFLLVVWGAGGGMGRRRFLGFGFGFDFGLDFGGVVLVFVVLRMLVMLMTLMMEVFCLILLMIRRSRLIGDILLMLVICLQYTVESPFRNSCGGLGFFVSDGGL